MNYGMQVLKTGAACVTRSHHRVSVAVIILLIFSSARGQILLGGRDQASVWGEQEGAARTVPVERMGLGLGRPALAAAGTQLTLELLLLHV